MSPKGKKTALLGTTLALAGYGLFLSALWASQDRMVFRGARRSKERYGQDDSSPVIDRTFDMTMQDGVVVKCFEKGPEDSPAILVLPGNGGNSVGYMRWLHAQIRRKRGDAEFRLVSLHYRGYGLSSGKVKGDRILSDVLELSKRISPVSVFGRSLGAGLGACVASELDIPAVLVSPWDSLSRVAGDKVRAVPYSILSRIFRHHVSPLTAAKEASSGLSVICFDADKVVRPWRTERLFSAWKGEKNMRIVPGGHRESITLTEDEVGLLLPFVEKAS